MSITTPDLDVVLYGAYGCVGRLAAMHMVKQTGLRWAVAGRNETKLKKLAAELKAMAGASSEPEMIVSPLGAGANLSWVKRARSVATAAGPFSVHEGECAPGPVQPPASPAPRRAPSHSPCCPRRAARVAVC